jgi:aconitate hydratase
MASGISRLPLNEILLENLLRNEDRRTVTKDDIKAVAEWLKTKTSDREFAFRPARVLMQDSPVCRRWSILPYARRHETLGGDPKKINPQVPVDLVIDHSVAVTFLAIMRVQKERRRGIPQTRSVINSEWRSAFR